MDTDIVFVGLVGLKEDVLGRAFEVDFVVGVGAAAAGGDHVFSGDLEVAGDAIGDVDGVAGVGFVFVGEFEDFDVRGSRREAAGRCRRRESC